MALVLRGGGYGGEWVSNLHTGVGAGHAGFVIPVNEVLTALRNYLARAAAQLGDATKLRTLTDWKPQYTFEQGLAETIEFLRGNLDQYKVGQYIL